MQLSCLLGFIWVYLGLRFATWQEVAAELQWVWWLKACCNGLPSPKLAAAELQ
jgi:hypothetical protein